MRMFLPSVIRLWALPARSLEMWCAVTRVPSLVPQKPPGHWRPDCVSIIQHLEPELDLLATTIDHAASRTKVVLIEGS